MHFQHRVVKRNPVTSAALWQATVLDRYARLRAGLNKFALARTAVALWCFTVGRKEKFVKVRQVRKAAIGGDFRKWIGRAGKPARRVFHTLRVDVI